MESMPLSGQHAARAMELRGLANLDSAHTGGGIAQNQLKPFSAARESTGRRNAAPYPYTQSVYKYTTLCV